MKKIQIYYFSGTGNTAFIVRRIAKGLEELGNIVTVSSCENTKEISDDFDVLGIAFPIHSSYSPKVFSDFMMRLPKANNIPLFGVVTSGYMAGDVLSYECKNLELKGYRPFLYRNIVVGNNLHLPVLCPLKVTTKDTIDKRLGKMDQQVKDIVIKINNISKDIVGNGLIGRTFGVLQRTVGKVHENYNFKGFCTDENCTRCKWCIKNCPTSNITLEDNIIVFEDRCIKCMRCYNFCPNKAIQVTKKTKNIKKYARYDGPEGLGSRSIFK